jgi:hypothetical protein
MVTAFLLPKIDHRYDGIQSIDYWKSQLDLFLAQLENPSLSKLRHFERFCYHNQSQGERQPHGIRSFQPLPQGSAVRDKL